MQEGWGGSAIKEKKRSFSCPFFCGFHYEVINRVIIEIQNGGGGTPFLHSRGGEGAQKYSHSSPHPHSAPTLFSLSSFERHDKNFMSFRLHGIESSSLVSLLHYNIHTTYVLYTYTYTIYIYTVPDYMRSTRMAKKRASNIRLLDQKNRANIRCIREFIRVYANFKYECALWLILLRILLVSPPPPLLHL